MSVASGELLSRFLDWVERAGNRLPHPFLIFVCLALFVVVLSWIVSLFGVTVEAPASGERIAVESLISRDGIEYILTSAVTNFADFPPLGTVLTIMLGIGLAQSVGTLTVGTGRNVIPDRAEMQVETRGTTEDLDAYVAGEARRIIEASAKMHAAEAEMEDVGRGTSAVCDEEWPGIVEEACGGAKFVLRVLPEASIGGSEDATVIMRRVRERGGMATYMIFGSPLAAGHHNPAFDWEEEAILVGVEALARTIRRLCAA